MWARSIGTIGLALNAIGVILAFFFGFPQPSHDEGVSILPPDDFVLEGGRTYGQAVASDRKRKERYLRWSRVGLSLMLIGFLVQLFAIWQ